MDGQEQFSPKEYSPNDPMNHVSEIELAARNLMGKESAQDVLKDQDNVSTLARDAGLFQSYKNAYPEDWNKFRGNINQQFKDDATARPNLPNVYVMDDGSITVTGTPGGIPPAFGTREIKAGRESLRVTDNLVQGA